MLMIFEGIPLGYPRAILKILRAIVEIFRSAFCSHSMRSTTPGISSKLHEK